MKDINTRMDKIHGVHLPQYIIDRKTQTESSKSYRSSNEVQHRI